MSAQADPQDLLLAYDPGFTGFTAASPLGGGAWPSAHGVLGGTDDPDGYYEDFTAHLDRFAREHPGLGAVGGGAWKALVLALDDAPDALTAGGARPQALWSSEEDDAAEGSQAGGAEGGPLVARLSDYVMDADGGAWDGGDPEPAEATGEMDETSAERAGGAGVWLGCVTNLGGGARASGGGDERGGARASGGDGGGARASGGDGGGARASGGDGGDCGGDGGWLGCVVDL